MKSIYTSFKRLLAVFAFAILPSALFAQYQITQKGPDINGLSTHGATGWSVSMPDSNTIAMGAPMGYHQHPWVYIATPGYVRIFNWDGTTWNQKGADLMGDTIGYFFGFSVSMPDPNTIAIGAIENWDVASNDSFNFVRIFRWNGSAWIQKGNDIRNDTTFGDFGITVSMPDSSTVAIGDPSFMNGQVRIYRWNGSSWEQKGSDIVGDTFGSSFGHSVCMPDPNTIAIGAPRKWNGLTSEGYVSIYNWNGSSWLKKGADILSDTVNDEFGYSVSMPDPNTIAIGVPESREQNYHSGSARIFYYNGTSWVQKGADILGNLWYTESFGFSVSMPDTNMVAIGSSRNFTSADSSYVNIYGWGGSAWTKKGPSIGCRSDYLAANIVSMPDSNTVGVGSPGGSNPLSWGYGPGVIRVYRVSAIKDFGLSEFYSNEVRIFPNPTSGTLNLELLNNPFDENTKIFLYDLLGNELLKETTGRVGNKYSLNVGHLSSGVYILKVVQNGEVLRTERVIVSK